MHTVHLSIRTRLALSFGAILLLMIMAATLGWRGISRLHQHAAQTLHEDAALAQSAAEMTASVLALRRYEKDVFINIANPAAVERYNQKWSDELNSLRSETARVRATAPASTQESIDDFAGSVDDYAAGFAQILSMIRAGTLSTTQRANDEMEKFKGAVRKTEKQLDEVVRLARERVAQSDALLMEKRRSLGLNLLAMSAAAIIIAAFLARSITRRITQQLNAAVELARNVAAGRLGNHIESRGADELAQLLQSLQQMDAALCEVIGGVRGAACNVSAAAVEIAKGNDDASRRSQAQAASLEQTAASMEQVAATIEQSAENIVLANRLAQDARATAQRGGRVVEEAIAAMESISNASRRIAAIISVIDDIAFQTNLLALNAAVEAARAGEQGRGFAVVATEVRSLAQRSAEAAREIKALIQESVDTVRGGSELVARSGASLAEIVAGVERVTSVVAEIAAANREQTAGIEQVNTAVMQLDGVTQQNAAVVEEIAAASKILQDEAQSLQRQVLRFRIAHEEQAQTHAAVCADKPAARLDDDEVADAA